MWNFLSSLLPGRKDPADELSLDQALKVLTTVDEKEVETPVHRNPPPNSFSRRVATITKVMHNGCIIDDAYLFREEDLNVEVGMKVLCEWLSSDGSEKVVNITRIDCTWDDARAEEASWFARVIVGKVDRRNGRNLYVSPGAITIDMDKVSMEFVPIEGDWLELDAKCVVDENSLDLQGEVIEINKVSPVRCHMQTGRVTGWNNDWGTVSNNIFFHRHSLETGYLPLVNDKVVVQVIESQQLRYSLRALKVLPEYMVKRQGNTSSAEVAKDFIEDYPGLDVGGLDVSLEKLNVRKNFEITVKNVSDEELLLLNISFPNINSQCKVINATSEVKISKNEEVQFACECNSKHIGSSKDFLLISFENFKLGKWVNVTVNSNFNRTNSRFQRKPTPTLVHSSDNELIKGRSGGNTRFCAATFSHYQIPQKLLENLDLSKEINGIILDLQNLKPVLFKNLTYSNYQDKFHTLLHLSELNELIAIRTYDQDRACFIKNGEYLMLEIENLAERRPSIGLGDKVIASDPLNQSKVDYEGCVGRVGAKHVYLKFSSMFHGAYDGEDYSIRVVPGRSTYRKLHHAISLVISNLGPELLFPTKLMSIMEPRVQISCDLTEDNKNGLKLEWFNDKLNLPQKTAVINILKGTTRPLPYIIFGPPGTGKTVTLIETVLQIIRFIPESRLLITAPSNSAVDLIALRLIRHGVLKPGELLRVVAANYVASNSIPVELVPYCGVCSYALEGTAELETVNNYIKYTCSRETIGKHRITVTTCNSAGQLYFMGLQKGQFSHIIVDEAAQATEPDVMIPLSFLDRNSGQIILAGDPMQLGPVIFCPVARDYGLNESYLERMTNRFPYVKDPESFSETYGYDPRLITKLVYNYRALPDILGLYSSLFYDRELISTIDDEWSPESALLNKLVDMLPKTRSNKPSRMVFHGVNGENYQSEDSPSWFNPHEAAQVFYYVNELYRLGLSSKQVGIITPYIKQIKEIRAVFTEAEFDMPKVGTVEEFQGQEFDVIILSTVRSCQEYVSNDAKYGLGFLSEPKRLNVAVSRAKSLLIIVGNPFLLCNDVYWRSVLRYCLDHGVYVGCDFSCLNE